ncbi:SH3 domain-containing protein [Barnesiella sp. An55]|uniref:SH3 domain-containing protein n=1 Tax=Barnesiella sp. An55 TaxID=1965646 RepID=UPI000B3B0274|nr:SH3 domain-containing protein [Barnesiella sp. An55]OUN74365.1 hypothetical protein B5G10_02055 [Barnesiella sp. An55]
MLKRSTLFVKIFLFLSLLLSFSCIHFRSHEKESEQLYDLYEVRIKSSLNVRSKPSSNSLKIGSLYNEDKVYVIDIEGNWAKIQYESKEAYVSAKYLTLVSRAYYAEKESETEQASSESVQQEAKESFAVKPPEILIYDNAGVLSLADSLDICQIFDGKNVSVVLWTIDTIDKGVILDYNSSVRKILKQELAHKLPNVADEDIYLVTFIKDIGLMQVQNEGNAMKFIEMAMPDKLLNIQLEARNTGLVKSMQDLLLLIDKASKEYEKSSWMVRRNVSWVSLGDLISETLTKEVILPSNSFFYKYVFSWVIAIPRIFVNFLISVVHSVTIAVILLSALCAILLVVVANVVGGGYDKNNVKVKFHLSLLSVALSFAITCITIVLFYAMCNLADITVMQLYGWNHEMTITVTQQNMHNNIPRSWWLSLIFFIGVVGYKLPSAWILVAGTLPNGIQKALAKLNPSHFEGHEGCLSKPDPYAELLTKKVGPSVGFSLVSLTILTLLLNGSAMLYVTIFTWSILLPKIYSMRVLYSAWKAQGLYKE